jgi:hypothetical protein
VKGGYLFRISRSLSPLMGSHLCYPIRFLLLDRKQTGAKTKRKKKVLGFAVGGRV